MLFGDVAALGVHLDQRRAQLHVVPGFVEDVLPVRRFEQGALVALFAQHPTVVFMGDVIDLHAFLQLMKCWGSPIGKPDGDEGSARKRSVHSTLMGSDDPCKSG
ncbi:conserved hypothetical protein [Stutzerimonas stutzeri A1501]|uniref:Uncharacterized protein n=1 Tax=Stutzerimonas stutzeri (strain A1501) TaxID=379731 RepID=A4VP57_STUS1|nr:conserved hypothetical protein [Stutzerimonas stutzeri A1501]